MDSRIIINVSFECGRKPRKWIRMEATMGNFLNDLKYRLRQWAAERYGNDELNRFLYFATIVFIVISFFGWLWRPLQFFYYLALISLIFSIFRFSSRNKSARLKERDFYFRAKNKFLGFFNLQKRRWTERKTHVFYTCPTCKTTIRVPRGKGRIEISCPKCRTRFIKTT